MRDLQPTSYSMDKKLRAFPLRSGTRQMMPSLTTPIQQSNGSPSHSNQTRKRSKRHANWKRGNKTVIVCRWHDSVHRKSYNSTQKLLGLISESGKTAGYKVNIPKSEVFLYTKNEILKTEIRKKITIYTEEIN